jgi:hypothetical protein
LGTWYATVWPWKVALFVHEPSLLPVLVPFAPSANVIEQFGKALVSTLCAHGVDRGFIDDELASMADCRLVPTKNRSVLGS